MIMASKSANKLAKIKIPRNFYSAQAAAQFSAQLDPSSQHPRISALPEGLTIASYDNSSAYSQISIFARAGSRYETYENAGLSHLLRACLGLKTQSYSSFLYKRQLEHWGANLSYDGGREFVQYSLSVPKTYLDDALDFLLEAAFKPVFHPWEVKDQFKIISLEKKNSSPERHLIDLLHKAAYRSAPLGNSIFYPDYKLEQMHSKYIWAGNGYTTSYKYFNSDELADFYKNTHTSPRIAMIAVGVDHEKLVQSVVKFEGNPEAGIKGSPSSYLGGDVRKEMGGDVAHIAVACPGHRVVDKEFVPLMVVQHILESGLTSLNGKTSVFNINYSDAGLFGVQITEDAARVNESVKAVVKAVRAFKCTQEDLDIAKKKAKQDLIRGTRCLAQMANLVSLRPELFDSRALAAAIDEVTLSSAQNALATVLKGKISMASVGAVQNVPYVDDL